MDKELGEAIIKAAKLLGNGDAVTNYGALEALGMAHKQGMEEISSSIERGLHEIAHAIEALSYAVAALKDNE
jgi:hypothetical protein